MSQPSSNNAGQAVSPSNSGADVASHQTPVNVQTPAPSTPQTPTTSVAVTADRSTGMKILGYLFGIGYSAGEFDLSFQRKRTRYFGLLGFLIFICFSVAGFGLYKIFNELMDIVAVPCCLLNEAFVSAKLKILAPLFGGLVFVVIASLLTLARISQQPTKKKDDPEQFGEIPSLVADLIKSGIGWLKEKAKG